MHGIARKPCGECLKIISVKNIFTVVCQNCDLCPNEGGAFKQTVTGEWVHLLCAIWIPETRVANDVFMEPITGVERISKQRWKLVSLILLFTTLLLTHVQRCCICQQRYGACIQCTKPSCFVAFHATCARKEKLLMPMKSAQGAEPASLTCFCDRHLPVSTPLVSFLL